MSPPLTCPELERWQTVLDESTPAELREDYERHLESCAACQDRLDRARQRDDPLIELARKVGDQTGVTADPAIVRFLDRMHERTYSDAADAGAGAEEGPADLYFLQPSDRPELLGTLGEYEVRDVIGQGGMGVVLKAFDPPLNRLVAIKVMAAAVAGSATARRRFQREAQAAAAVCHDHIVTVHGVHEQDGLPYLVMQYIAGESLQDRLDRSGPLELVEIIRIGLQTAQGLAAAHAQGLIHRDIKPANLLLENGVARVKITDFGLARSVDDVPLTQQGVLAGTPEYMAPEQARGEIVDHRADLFSLGCVLYAMSTAGPPFRGASAVAVLRQVSDAAHVPIRSLNPNLPAWLETLIERLMAKDPADRLQSAAEVAGLLERYLAHLQQPAAVAAPELPPARGSGGKHMTRRLWQVLFSWSGFLLVSALLLELAGIAWCFGGGADEPARKKETAREFYHSFRDRRDITSDFDWDGMDPQGCVTFEPEGLHVTLPVGVPGRRMGTGLQTTIRVKGDFEITMGFEVLKEPRPADAAGATGLYLWLDLDTPGLNRSLLFRAMAAGPRFSSWFHLSDDAGKQVADESRDYRPTQAMKGRLRMVRNGAVLSHYAAEEAGEEFILLGQHPYGAEDVRSVRIGGITGGPKAALEFRITDLRIRAEMVPEAVAPSPPASGREWLAIALAVSFVLTLSLGAWHLVRRRSRLARSAAETAPPSLAPEGVEKPAEPAESTETSGIIAFACSGCGKRLKAKAKLTGKKVKCPACALAVVVPQAAS
jgi:serine/threonine protein kinase